MFLQYTETWIDRVYLGLLIAGIWWALYVCASYWKRSQESSNDQFLIAFYGEDIKEVILEKLNANTFI